MKKFLTIAIALMMSMSLSGACAQDTAVDTLWQQVYGAIGTIRANEKGEHVLVKAVNPGQDEEDGLSMFIKLETPSPLMLSDWMLEQAQARQQEEWNAESCQKRVGDQFQQMMNMSYSLAQQYAYTPVNMEKLNTLINGKETMRMYLLMSAYQCGENSEAGMEIECVPFMFFLPVDTESGVALIYENAIYIYIRMVQGIGESEVMVSEYVVADQEQVGEILSTMKQIESVTEEDRDVIVRWLGMGVNTQG